jgi:hypothetical protein
LGDLNMDRKVLLEIMPEKYDIRSWIAINRLK